MPTQRFRDLAVCIRHLDWSETSQIVGLITREHGKVSGLAKGSKRTSKSSVARFSGGIDLLTVGEVVGILKPNVELATLVEWDLQQPNRHLHYDLVAQRLGLYAADLCNAILAEHDAHPRVYEALVEYLAALAERGGAARQAALLRFQWRLLEDLGYRPELDADAVSGETLAPDESTYTFDARAGGVTRQPTGLTGTGMGAGPWRVRRETVFALRAVASGQLNGSTDLKSIERANRLLCVYARAILDRHLPTMDFVLEGAE